MRNLKKFFVLVLAMMMAFIPKREITRAEMAAIVYRVMTGDVKDENVKLHTARPAACGISEGLFSLDFPAIRSKMVIPRPYG